MTNTQHQDDHRPLAYQSLRGKFLLALQLEEDRLLRIKRRLSRIQRALDYIESETPTSDDQVIAIANRANALIKTK